MPIEYETHRAHPAARQRKFESLRSPAHASAPTEGRVRASVIGVPIDVLTWDGAIACIDRWGKAHESRVVCICSVHSVVTAHEDEGFRRIICQSDMATADGFPVAYMLRRVGHTNQQRIAGPDLMWKYCEHAALTGGKIFLYGGSPDVLDKLVSRLRQKLPHLVIAGAYSPPFRNLTEEEDEDVVRRINASGAETVWVGLGCPKQERWMQAHRGRINAVMIGVGAAFDYHAGTLRRAPLWMQRWGLEWLYRLAREPRRLWKRYLVTNTRFVLAAARQLMASRPAASAGRGAL